MKTMTKSNLAGPFRLGVDIGRVLVSGEGSDTSFFAASDEMALRTREVSGALAAVVRLATFLEGRVWIVSKCGPKIERRSRAWLDHHRFFERSRLPREQLLFCRERRDKAGICERLGIHAFVDDREDVLQHMSGIVPHRFLFGAERAARPGLVPVRGWAEAEPAIVKLVTSARASSVAERAP